MRFDENKLGRIWFKLHDIEQQQHFGWHEQMGRVNSVRCALPWYCLTSRPCSREEAFQSTLFGESPSW